ncbi:purine-cytosine permease FCY21 [Purpureocillium lavendulum]|uniref:Purine-cytosine permease FCY21 n=1 Tax=Purpureocillium lavendulum TaxID=1247861 RepID=A0AB34G683_9HYPO|nr:purine-cytosine permease FCY21 [Purpureocillium lavendulum]
MDPDYEKGLAHQTASVDGHDDAISGSRRGNDATARRTAETRAPERGQGHNGSNGSGLLARLRDFEARLDAKFGVESEAIVRKLPEDRRPVSWVEELSMALLWASGVMNLGCFATGLLGWQFGLSLGQSILIVVLFSIAGGAVSGYCATFGAATGLRQISISRYSFGWWPNKLIALLNCIEQIGWAAVQCITGGLALTAVSDGHVSLILGVCVLAVVALLISLVGLNCILVYERYAWIIFLVIFLIIYGFVGEFADIATPASVSGATFSGSVLTFIATIYGSSASWCVITSDYYVHYPVDVSRLKVFLMTTFGIAIPTSIGMVAGCVVASTFSNRPEWGSTYKNEGLGYLIQAILHPRGFAKLILTLLVLSGINNMVMNLYSSAISFQQLARPCAQIPRVVWTLFCFVCIMALAIGGRENLNDYLVNFLSILGYWCTSYAIILFEEHVFFRKGSFENYNLEGWNDPAKLPVGIGAAVAFLLGVVSWCLGMSQTWFQGVLAKMIGDNGGDVGSEMTFVVTALSYPPARYLELKAFGR